MFSGFDKSLLGGHIVQIKKKNIVFSWVLFLVFSSASLQADDFSDPELARWEAQFMQVVKQGDDLFHGGLETPNKVACAQCHPNAANTHPETYPKFQKQLGKVAELFEMINWCIKNPLEGKQLSASDPKMTAMQAYIKYERRGVKLNPGSH